MSKLYNPYDHVRDDLNRNAQEHDLLLGKDYLITRQAWDKLGYQTPLAMITVQSWSAIVNR